VNNLIKIGIWVAVVGSIFAFLWWKGYIAQIANYVRETKEELRKCSWPTWDELKGSTVLVLISIALIGLYTVAVDFAFAMLIRWIT
jgi:preprotein translocase subunit SecE